jgi:hypothetical protein
VLDRRARFDAKAVAELDGKGQLDAGEPDRPATADPGVQLAVVPTSGDTEHRLGAQRNAGGEGAAAPDRELGARVETSVVDQPVEGAELGADVELVEQRAADPSARCAAGRRRGERVRDVRAG